VFDAIVTYSYMENAFTCMKAQAMTLSRVHVESLPKQEQIQKGRLILTDT